MPKPFLTPASTSEDVQCRTLITPNNKEWLGVFNSALLEMVNPYNWEQVHDTDLTIEESITIVEAILAEYFATPDCVGTEGCMTPEGTPIMRLSASGHFEMLTPEGWAAPTGDYTVPPVPEREEATPYTRRCAAAENAQNVLQQTYEIVSDAAAMELDHYETIALMVAYFLSAVGAWLGLAAEALIWLTYGLFVVFFEIAEFMTSDLWDEEFSDLLKCVLLDCANDSGDVVTFNFECVNEGLAAAVDLGNVDALTQLRLFGQVSFMLSIIGADGLNAAGATTEITTPNCDDCGGWCYEVFFEDEDGDFEQIPAGTSAPYGVYSSGVGWTTTDALDTIPAPDVYNRMLYVGRELPFSAEFTHVEVDLNYSKGSFFSNRRAQGCEIGISFATTIIDINSTPATNGTPVLLSWDGLVNSDSIVIFARSSAVTGSPVYSGSAVVKRLLVRGNGDNPFGIDNCD